MKEVYNIRHITLRDRPRSIGAPNSAESKDRRMFYHHTLIFLLATVLGSLADHGFLKDRRFNYNSNANNNQLFGGYNGGHGRDIANDRDRGMIYANPTKYDGMPKSGIGSGRDRGGLYVSPKYILRGDEGLGDGGLRAGGSGGGNLGAGRLRTGGSGGGNLGAGRLRTGGSGGGNLGAGRLRTGGSGAGGLRTGGLRTGGLGAAGLGAGGLRTRGSGAGGLRTGGSEAVDLGAEGLGSGGFGAGALGAGDWRADYDTIGDGIVYGGDYNDENCDYSFNNQLSGYDDDQEGNKRYSGLRPYGDGNGGWGSNVNSNANSNDIGSRNRRTDNWGPLRATYFIEREPTYVTDLQTGYGADHQPTYVIDLQSDYGADRQPTYVADRQPTYVADRQQTYSTERQPIYSGELQPYPTTLRPNDDDYDTEYQGSNMNSNVNYNYLTGRRSNINYNANNNDIRSAGYGQGPVHNKYHKNPSHSGYDQEGYNLDRTQGRRGTHGGFNTKRYKPGQYRTHPEINADNEDDVDDDDDHIQFGGANVNSNSNTNILARRSNPRSRRSVKTPLKESDRVGHLGNDGTTKVSKAESSTARGPVAQKWESPMPYQEGK